MNNLYIPRGKTLRYESLTCRDIVNDGVLIVEKTVQARTISGHGILNAGSISCQSVTAMDMEAADITAERLAAERVCASEVRVSGAALVSCCLEASYVETPRLTVAVSQIGELRAREVVNLPDKRQSILAALVSGFLRSLWLSLTRRIPADAEFEPVPEEKAPEQDRNPSGGAGNDLAGDLEFNRLMDMYRLLKDSGYTLRLDPLSEEFAGPFEETDFQDAA